MMRWAPRNSIQRRRILACSILLAVLAFGALPSASQASRKLHGVGFSTILPNGWKLGKYKNGSSIGYRIAAPHTKKNTTVNSTVIGITVVPVKDLERQSGRKIPASMLELWGLMVVAPPGAQQTQIVAPVRTTTVDGTPGASGAASYFLGGTTVLQSDTVCVHRGHVYLIELATDINIQFKGLPAFGRVRSHWRWN